MIGQQRSPSVRINAEARSSFERAARRAYPEEACGLMLGERSGSAFDACYRIERFLSCRNIAPDPRTAFELHPVDLKLAYERHGEARILGVGHTHPDTPVPSPSERDLRAARAGWCYWIGSVEGQRVSWRVFLATNGTLIECSLATLGRTPFSEHGVLGPRRP